MIKKGRVIKLMKVGVRDSEKGGKERVGNERSVK
jgi:hypothetical protein